MHRLINIFSLLFALSWNTFHVSAQSFYNTGATVSVLPNTIFSVQDSLVNTGTFINNGNLIIGGTWLNTGTYDAGAGEITFNSTSSTTPQIINHSNQSFSKLTISGGGKKLILADITIEEQIILEDGVIEAQNNSRVIVNATATISGGSDLAHINAPVYHHGNGEKLFPLGNGSVYLPVTLLNIEGPSSFIGIEGVEPIQSTPLLKAPSLDEISNVRYWRIDVLSGTVNSPIMLPVRDEALLNDMDHVVVVQSPDLSGNFESIGRLSASGTITNGMVTSDRAASMPLISLGTSTDNGAIFVYNAVSANADGLNDFLRILNIENFPENTFSIFTRWGDKIFEMKDYDNKERVFKGKSNVNGEKDLVNGTYFYVIETKKGNQKINGFLSVKN